MRWSGVGAAIAIAAAVMLPWDTLHAQERGIVSGRVVDSDDGRPLGNVSVRIGNPEVFQMYGGEYWGQPGTNNHTLTVESEFRFADHKKQTNMHNIAQKKAL